MRRLPLIPLAALVGCTSALIPPAPVQPAPVVALPAALKEMPPVYRGDWRDWPVTPGDWVYRQDARGSIALFGPRGSDAEMTIRCDRTVRQIFVSRRGAAPGNAPMVVRTSSVQRSVATQPTGGSPAYMAVALDPRDPLLDAIVFSRGRFVIEQATLPTLVIPAWAEFARVMEDCRR